MKAIIIEDEKLSAEHLTRLLKKADKQIQVVACYDTVKSVVEAFSAGVNADVLFMDIHLADGLSFEVFSAISIDTPVIFTTAYDEYAIKAFKVNSIDYLLKPIGLTELMAAIEKLRKLRNSHPEEALPPIQKAYESMTRQYKNRFMVKMGEHLVSVKTDDISHFVAEDGIVLLCTKNEKRYPVDYTLDQLEELVDLGQFFRINRKSLVHINAIQKISTYFKSRLKIVAPGLLNDDCVVSRERVNDFKLWLDGGPGTQK